MASLNAESSSSRAGISVSGTYRPPKAPKRVAIFGAILVRADTGRGRVELSHQPRVLHSGRHLYPRGYVDNVRSKRANSSPDVVGFESPGKHYRRAPAVAGKVDSKIAPRQGFPRSTQTLLAPPVPDARAGR